MTDIKAALIALLAGLVFGVGLYISQMVNPAKVLGFLDVAGNWDPSLAVVMGGALAVTALGNAFARAQPAPLLATSFQWPTSRQIDARLVGGAALFGIGWGLVGFCPGPALAGLSLGLWPVAQFVAAMFIGMAAHAYLVPTPGTPVQPA
jgi:uncharacterized membrane protein YedE/YeeE